MDECQSERSHLYIQGELFVYKIVFVCYQFRLCFTNKLFFLQDGDKFWRMPECYIRGSTIKYLRIPDEVIDMVKEDVQMKSRGRGELKGRGGQNQRGNRQGQRGKQFSFKLIVELLIYELEIKC